MFLNFGNCDVLKSLPDSMHNTSISEKITCGISLNVCVYVQVHVSHVCVSGYSPCMCMCVCVYVPVQFVWDFLSPICQYSGQYTECFLSMFAAVIEWCTHTLGEARRSALLLQHSVQGLYSCQECRHVSHLPVVMYVHVEVTPAQHFLKPTKI